MASTRRDAARAGQPQVVPVVEVHRGQRHQQRQRAAAMRAACSQIQSLPSCTGSDAADSASMKPTSSSVMPPVTDRREHDQRHQHQQAEMLGVPAPRQGQPAAADHRGERQADGAGTQS